MRIKLLLLLCCLFFVEGWAGLPNNKSTIIIQIKKGTTPIEATSHPSEVAAIYFEVLNISFNDLEDFAFITVTNKATGEVVYSEVYINVEEININTASYDKGQYLIEVSLENNMLEGVLTVD